MREFLAYGAAPLTGLWSIAHAVPTRQVVAGFEPITLDNRRAILQEWVAESVALWGIALTVVAATVAGNGTDVTEWVYRIASGPPAHRSVDVDRARVRGQFALAAVQRDRLEEHNPGPDPAARSTASRGRRPLWPVGHPGHPARIRGTPEHVAGP
ncbi:hypothetical protein [Nocardia sp. R6R-6]|uniref:hypothetical protein n=1 Tax=Nocardia sp. R6R-6 TaxID=3459303 RepID=UPI00403D7A93